MKENGETVLLGHRVVLVPYESKHVPKYHEWMLDAELRDLTASEPLTLQEEYNMQQAWRRDEDKLTFIILARHTGDELDTDVHDLSPEDPRITALSMVGDVNLFLKGNRPATDFEPGETRVEDKDDFEVEVEIMIADRTYRRKGLAFEAILLLLTYATGQSSAFTCWSSGTPVYASSHLYLQSYLDHIQASQSPRSLTSIITPDRLVSRISDSNEASIYLFEKLGFSVVKKVAVFQEVEMRWQQA